MRVCAPACRLPDCSARVETEQVDSLFGKYLKLASSFVGAWHLRRTRARRPSHLAMLLARRRGVQLLRRGAHCLRRGSAKNRV